MKTSTKQNHRTRRRGAAAILALALPLIASPPVAADDNGRNIADPSSREMTLDQRTPALGFSAARPTDRSKRVTLADLDLNRPAGLERLYQRLTVATTAVCSPREYIRDIPGNRDRKACIQAAMDNAVSHVGHPGLEAMHASRTGRSTEPRQQTASR